MYETLSIGKRVFRVTSDILCRVLDVLSGSHEYFDCDGRVRVASCRNGPGFLSAISSQPSLEPAIIMAVDMALANDAQGLDDALGFIEFPPDDGAYVQVPDVLHALVDIEAPGLGAGEALVPAMFGARVEWSSAGSRYDFCIDGKNWHFKDHRTCDSTPMGRVVGSDAFFDTPIMRFISTLPGHNGSPINTSFFGTTDFLNNESVEARLVDRYGCDLEHAAQMFEDELQREFRASQFMGDAAGMLYLMPIDGRLCIKRVDKDSVCFHSNTGRGVKACSTSNRFANKIMVRTRRLMANERDTREAEHLASIKRGLATVAKDRKLRQAQAEKLRKQVEKRANDEHEAQRFATVYRQCVTIKATAKALSISVSTALKRKSMAQSLGLL